MLRPFGPAQDRPFDYAQDRPFDYAQDRPFDYAQDRLAQYERKITNVFNTGPVRPEPFDFAQDRLVEACGEFIEPGKREVFQQPARDMSCRLLSSVPITQKLFQIRGFYSFLLLYAPFCLNSLDFSIS